MSEDKYAVNVELVISIVVEATSPDHAADIVAGMEFPLGDEILRRITDGNYDVREIETEGRVP